MEMLFAELSFSEEMEMLSYFSLTKVQHRTGKRSFRLLIFFLRGKALNSKYIYFSYYPAKSSTIELLFSCLSELQRHTVNSYWGIQFRAWQRILKAQGR